LTTRSVTDDSRSVIDNYRSIIEDSRSIIDEPGSIIDDTRSIIDYSIVMLQLVASFTIIIYDRHIFIAQATEKC
jgi:hypothetical protein